MNRATAISLLPPYTGYKNILSPLGAGTNKVLVKDILARFPYAVKQAAKLAPRFKKGNLQDDAQAVWNFLKTQVTYKEDSGLFQHIKAPNALLTIGYGDCKSDSLFAAAIMANLGHPVTFRFVGYGGINYPGHVYVVAGKGSNAVIIDAVYTAFNAEKKPYSYKKDYPMEIANIGSIGCANCTAADGVGKIQLAKAVKKAATAVKSAAKTATTAVKKAASPAAKAALNVVKKAGGIAPRTAFLQFVKLNIHSAATRLSKNRANALNLWAKLGGDKGELNASINAGQNRKPIFGFDGEVQGVGSIGEVNGIGIVAASTAAIIAAAAPIIVAFTDLLKDKTKGTPTTDGSPVPSGSNTGNDATSVLTAASNILEKFTGNKNAAPATAAENSGYTAAQTSSYSADTAAPNAAAALPGEDSTGTGNKWILPAAILAAIFLLK